MIYFKDESMTLIVKLEGELDHHTSIEVKEKINRAMKIKHAKNLILNFEDLDFMDSSGIGMIIGRYKYVQEIDGKIAITNANSQIKRIITVSGLQKIIPVFNSVENALKQM